MANSLVRATGSVREAVRETFEAERRNSVRIQKMELGLSDDDELPPYIHLDYPKALYPADPEETPITVQTAAEEHRKVAQGYCSTYAEAEAAWNAVPADAEEEATDVASMASSESKRGRGRPRKS